ncbi:MAG: hypothetical protein ABIR24_03070 [Verrucomicrobiota bacterium]
MTIFELAFLIGSIALVIFISSGLGHFFGISWWFFAVPVAALEFLLIRWLGERAMGKRRNKWPFEKRKRDKE